MGIQIEERTSVLEIRATGHPSQRDYAAILPRTKDMVSHQGKIRLLFEMSDFHGWSVAAMWEDARLDLRHFAQIERVALVTDKAWERWMPAFCSPFVAAEVRCFPRTEKLEAKKWIEQSTEESLAATRVGAS